MKCWNLSINVRNKIDYRHIHTCVEWVYQSNAGPNSTEEVVSFLVFFVSVLLKHLWPAGWKVEEAFVLNSVSGWHSRSTLHAVCHERLTHLLLTWVRISSWPMMCSRVLVRPGGTPSSDPWDCAWTWGGCWGKPRVCVWWVEDVLVLRCLSVREWVALLWLPLRLPLWAWAAAWESCPLCSDGSEALKQRGGRVKSC